MQELFLVHRGPLSDLIFSFGWNVKEIYKYVGFLFLGMALLTSCFNVESLVDEKTRELKSKDETLSLKEKLVQEKSDNILSLQKELASLQVCVK